jgi:tRNA(fMet)-specific endonuclease VapC
MESPAEEARTAGAGTMSFLLDTDICSAHLKHGGKISSRFLQYTGRLHISTITLGELHAWAMRAAAPPKRLQGLREMLDDVEVLEVTAEVAEKYGEMQAALLDAGVPAPGMDLMIAATAIVHDLTLVTHNTRDFADLPALRVVDWLVP